MGIFIRCAGHNGPVVGYQKNLHQGGALHRPYEGMLKIYTAPVGAVHRAALTLDIHGTFQVGVVPRPDLRERMI